MARQPIATGTLRLPNFDVWNSSWMLLTAGRLAPREFNSMTVSWGTLGVLWGRDLAICFVRPQRYTYGFMERSPDFTLCVFPPRYKDALTLMGSRSGRDTDKVKESGLTPIASTRVTSPGYDEADLIIECRKIYFHDIQPERFVDPTIEDNYNNDYHRVYFGEIVAVQGTEAHQR